MKGRPTPHDTEALIAALANKAAPVRANALTQRLLAGLALGGVVTLVLVIAGLGVRPDLWAAMHGPTFWMKWAYTGSLALLALAATRRLARPDADGMGGLWLIAVPMAALAAIGLVEMARVPPAEWLAMWLGMSWRVCSSLVFLLSLPTFIGLLWAYRAMAPTDLRRAGATAGLAAGAWSATLYCLHCPEVSAIFVLTWYTLGIALAALLGAFAGPRLMRW
jgi:hypothetical protein